jgi:hypothetical protein
MGRRSLGAATLFDDGCPDEDHTWSEPTVAETSVGTLTGQTCQVCGLVWVRLTRTGTPESLGLIG